MQEQHIFEVGRAGIDLGHRGLGSGDNPVITRGRLCPWRRI